MFSNKIKILCFVNGDGLSNIQLEIIKNVIKKYKNLEFSIVKNTQLEVVEKYGVLEYPTTILETESVVKKFSGLTQEIFIERAIEELINNVKK